MTDEERLEEAKKLFPIGTKFNNRNIDGKGTGIVHSIPKNDTRIRADVIQVKDENGMWVTIISSPINKEPTYEIY